MLKLNYEGQEIEIRFSHRKLDHLHQKFVECSHETTAEITRHSFDVFQTKFKGITFCHH